MQEMNDYSKYIVTSRYSRFREDLGRRELWPETVDRLMDFWEEKFPELLGSTSSVETSNQKKELRDAIVGLEAMPSMRTLMTAGPALKRDPTAAFNCAYTTIESIRDFDEILYILMCGTGVGFSVESKYVNQLPNLPESFHKSDTIIVVPDSKIGWATSFKELLSLLWAGKVPQWDVSRVRPAGAPLKTFGGRASGPRPLVSLFMFAVEMMTKAAGRKLRPIECHDLVCKIAEIVVVGGVRRSALISLSDLGDEEMRNAKSGKWWETHPHRALANNSAVYENKPAFSVFFSEWKSLYESQSGERGIFNREASTAAVLKTGRRDPDWDFGTNPCCVSSETPILTKEGYQRIEDVVGRDVEVWNGEGWARVIPYAAGEGQLQRVRLSDGTYLDCTENHRWVIDGEFVQTKDLKAGDKLTKFDMPVVGEYGGDTNNEAYSQGFYSGDGNGGYEYSWVYIPKYPCIPRLIGKVGEEDFSNSRRTWKHGPMIDKTWVPLNQSLDYRLSWLAGLLDADGSVTRDKNGNGLQICSVENDFLFRLRLMLTTLGVRAKIVGGADAGFREMPDGRGGSKNYYCQQTKRLLIGNTDTHHLMKLGLKCERLEIHANPPQRDARQFVRVSSVEWLDRYEMTYCFTEPKTGRGTFNGIVTGNSEIILRPRQFCNLSEVVVREGDSLETLRRKVRIATILGTLQATLTDFRYLRREWQRNTEEEALLGVSLTGICDHPVLQSVVGGVMLTGNEPRPYQHTEDWLEELKHEAIKVNKEWAGRLGINPSASITCVKPSGTVSQAVDSASGMHARYSPFYIRSVRNDIKDPLCQFLIDQGVPHEPCFMKPNDQMVFFFPQRAPSNALCNKDVTAIQQMQLWLTYQRHWCEHKPSITVFYSDDEFLELGQFVWKNFDELSGVSFLPRSEHSYVQAPYQEVTENEYLAAVAKMPKNIDWEILYLYDRGQDNTEGTQTLACTGNNCDL